MADSRKPLKGERIAAFRFQIAQCQLNDVGHGAATQGKISTSFPGVIADA